MEVLIDERALRWIVSNNTGISSRHIWSVMTGIHNASEYDEAWYPTVPSDPSDFGRCYDLLKLIPEWEKQLDKLRDGKAWSWFVDNYDFLCELYEEEYKKGRCPQLYHAMKPLRSGFN